MNVRYRGAFSADTAEMSRLIAVQNNQVHRHVGYCGVEASEIRHTLENDFEKKRLEQDFTLALLEEKVVGVLGFDLDPDTGLAEIWGPFADEEEKRAGDCANKKAGPAVGRAELIEGLWRTALERANGSIVRLQGFYHQDNAEAESLMRRSGASLAGRHLTLALRQADFSAESQEEDSLIAELGAEFEEAFVRLHDEAFPGSYASGHKLLEERDAEHRLIGYVREGELLGYAFVSGSRTFAEGDVEFLASAARARGQGVGQNLLRAALRLLFEEFAPAEARLTVSATNAAAIGLYRKCGFRVREEMNVYELNFAKIRSASR
ncbi:hypothetical protein CDO73_15625 [Saccharibacillus sp. O23]|uniref:GNAT family N-acetyltransferase n=1 Tax=Saccharibacillus sp. O23 TaxID=2009338 RepID=UPI000B4E6066|nr:GNAT family N-acetyltransferase [Saccharibacillus sp. O23]OWR29611.1 hypothetical protein CDO73_15625 [Saccharibacillus sp. O23]